jgi:hypothetical protein
VFSVDVWTITLRTSTTTTTTTTTINNQKKKDAEI